MRLAKTARRATVISLLLLGSACARAVSVGTDSGPVYAIQVRNTLSTDMIVSYDAGNGPAVLGTVRPNTSERFVITSPTANAVQISATNQNRTRSSGPYTVQLQAGSTPEVVLR